MEHIYSIGGFTSKKKENEILRYSLITLSILIHNLKTMHAFLNFLKDYSIFILYMAFVLLLQYFLEPLRSPVCCTLQSD